MAIKTTNFHNMILEIDQIKSVNGVLGKMDIVLRLSKKGYKREQILAGLDYVARHIKNDSMRDLALTIYSARVR